MPLLEGIVSELADADDLLRLLVGIQTTDKLVFLKWDLSETNVIVWGVSNDESIAWPDRDVVVQQLGRAYDAIEQYINVDFQFGGVFDNPISAAEAQVDLVAYPTADNPANRYGAIAVFPIGHIPIEFPDYTGVEGDFKVMLRPDGSTPSNFAEGSIGFSLLLHEIGHTLGLKHPHEDGATIADVDLPKGFDNDWASFMSYKDEFAFEQTAWNPVTPMVLDVLALQYLYGPNIEHNAGDTEFTVRRYDDYYTYWDPSGDDVVNASEAIEGWNIYLPYLQISTQQSTMSGLAVPVSQDTDSFDTFAPTDLVWLMGEIENAIGSNFDDGLIGNVLDNFLSSGGGDDVLRGAEGNDQLDGGAGQDIAAYSGNQASYTLNLSPSGTTIKDRRPSQDGTDTLVDIEFLDFESEIPVFNGNPLDLQVFGGHSNISSTDLESIIELYIAYFNRAPDAIGLGFWATGFTKGQSLEEMAFLFVDQDETRTKYPEGTTNTEFATSVYNNVLGRDPDQSGLDFWVGHLDSGAHSRDGFILEFLGGVQPGTLDRAFLDNKTDIGAYYAVHKGMSDVDNAAEAMALFNGTEGSIDDAVAAIDGYYADALDPNNGEFLMPLVGVIDDPFAVA